MYNQNSINASSSVSIESIESSVTKLDQTVNRRRRWKLFFNPNEEDEHQVATNTSPWRNNIVKFLDSNPTHIVCIILLVSDLALTILDLSSTFQSCPRTGSKEVWFHWVGIGILGILLVKTLGLLVGQGWVFFTQPGYIVDGLVLIGAVFMEVFMAGKGGGLLVVVSLWRVIRVVENAFELSDEAIESQIEAIKNELDLLKEENTQYK